MRLEEGAEAAVLAHLSNTPRDGATQLTLPLAAFNNSRRYWSPQLHDPLLAPYPLLTFDAIGFSSSALAGAPWSFDLAAALVLAVLERLSEPGGPLEGRKSVLVGDSMGGGPTGLRVLLRGEGRVSGVVVVGSAAEEESEGTSVLSVSSRRELMVHIDFVEEYTAAAASFAAQALDPSIGPRAAIARLAHNMAQDGYTPSLLPPFPSARAFGEDVIRESLERTLVNSEGVLEGGAAGRAMVVNFGCLNHRKGLVEELSKRPSPLGEGQVLVMHGTLDKAVSSLSLHHLCRKSLTTFAFAVPLRTRVPHTYLLRRRRRQR